MFFEPVRECGPWNRKNISATLFYIALALGTTYIISPQASEASTSQSDLSGRWNAQIVSDNGELCSYTLQLNADFSWEDISNQKYRSGMYVAFDDSAQDSSKTKKILLQTVTDNFLPDCQNSRYNSIGSAQVLNYTEDGEDSSTITLGRNTSGNSPSPQQTPLIEVDTPPNAPSLSPYRDETVSAPSGSEPSEGDSQPSSPDAVGNQNDSQTPSTVAINTSDNTTQIINTDTSQLPTEEVPATDAQNTLAFSEATSNSALSVPINREDWIVTRSANVKFGDHSNDSNFAASQANDKESIKVTIKANSNWGTGTYFLFPPGVEQVWVGFCVRFPNNWNARIGGKLPGLSGNTSESNGGQGGAASNGENAWSARMMYGPYDSSTDTVPVGSYVYHTDQASVSNFGDPEWWSPLPHRLFSDATRLSKNEWHEIKQRVKVNTPYKNNGIIEAWVNNTKTYSRSNFNFTNKNSFREIYKFWLDVYHGGQANGNQEIHVYFDQINYSIESDHIELNCR